MAFVLAPEAVEGAVAVGEGAEEVGPEVETEAKELEAEYEDHEAGLKAQESDPWKTSMSQLFLYNSLANQNQPVVVNNNVNNNIPITGQATPPVATEQPPVQDEAKPDSVEQKNEKILEGEQQQLKDEQQEIINLESKPKTPTVLDQIKQYTEMYQRNLSIFQQQVDSFNNIYEQSKNYKFF